MKKLYLFSVSLFIQNNIINKIWFFCINHKGKKTIKSASKLFGKLKYFLTESI